MSVLTRIALYQVYAAEQRHSQEHLASMTSAACRQNFAEHEKDERQLLKASSRGDKDRRRGTEPSEKDQQHVDPRFMRERAKYAAKWAALHPLDDLEVSSGYSCHQAGVNLDLDLYIARVLDWSLPSTRISAE